MTKYVESLWGFPVDPEEWSDVNRCEETNWQLVVDPHVWVLPLNNSWYYALLLLFITTMYYYYNRHNSATSFICQLYSWGDADGSFREKQAVCFWGNTFLRYQDWCVTAWMQHVSCSRQLRLGVPVIPESSGRIRSDRK